jgi:methylglutaconyl-CoA hydratase
MAKAILQERHDGMLLLTLNRPQAGNRVNGELLHTLQDICSDVAADDSVKVVILTGSRNTFCLGSEPAMAKSARELSAASLISNIRCPVIAAINGDAIGQGLEIALACDIRICALRAVFSLPAVHKGHIPEDGGTQRLPRIIGLSRAMDMILTAREVKATEALETGLVSATYESAELLAAASKMAVEMTKKSPLAVGFAKEAINKGLDLTLEQGLRLEADLYFLLHTTEDRCEGIKAFREKRKPEFKGR